MCSVSKHILYWLLVMSVKTKQTVRCDVKSTNGQLPVKNIVLQTQTIHRKLRSTSTKYEAVRKKERWAVLLGSDLYIPCGMKDPIGWLKGDYILFMDGMDMYDKTTFGEEKFKLGTNPSRSRHALHMRNAQFSDAGSYFCQNGKGEKSRMDITVIEPPSCHHGRTKLREGDLTTYTCAVRLQGEHTSEVQLSWNKKEEILKKPSTLTSGTGVEIVTSELKYRAKYEDNQESVNCYVTIPSWNETTSPSPSCSAGVLNIIFEPRLICEDHQIFPDDPEGSFYVYCDVVANPIKNLDSIMWLVSTISQMKPIENVENMTRKDVEIPNGYRSRVAVPYKYIKSKGGSLEFNVKMYYAGNTFSKSIEIIIHSSIPSTVVTLCIIIGVVITLGIIGLLLIYLYHHQRMGEYEVARRRHHDAPNALQNGSCISDTEDESNLEPIYDDVAKESYNEPNNQRPQPEGQTKRKVRFKINI